MSEALTKIVVNCETGVQEIIPLTIEEVAELEANSALVESNRALAEAEAASIAEAKANGIAKLLALGLTEEEANALSK